MIDRVLVNANTNLPLASVEQLAVLGLGADAAIERTFHDL
jgi:hypothetical protein